MRWRYVISPPATGSENMALDEVLLRRAAEQGEGVLRLYAWSAPTLSLGRNQMARGEYDLDRARTLGVDFVRRPTGGRALLHHREITYSVTAPTASLGDLGESYARINRLLVAGCRALGAEVCVAGGAGAPPPPTAAPCFERPVSGEIVAEGRKLIGSAQWRDRGALLQHGSILIEDDQSLAAELLVGRREPPPPAATLTSLLGRRPSSEEVSGALIGALRTTEDPRAEPLALDEGLRERVRAAISRYRDEDWTWRR